ncbi:MAG TPA: hypothetical protein PLF84_03575 [Bryobacteraceae bacterium]|nr:hypothetical protein [Bryobacterales bacterium]HRJ18091.1 hypothetical protein [Bryobacteraceae bacterium]
MFFKREKPRVLTFSGQMDHLRGQGYSVDAKSNGTLIRKGGFAVLARENAEGQPEFVDTGLAVGDEVAVLTSLGYQMIFMTEGGRKTPALAEHLKGLHNFVEDLREELGLTSLYNQALGTTNEKHLYDRVNLRDTGNAPKPWEKRG